MLVPGLKPRLTLRNISSLWVNTVAETLDTPTIQNMSTKSAESDPIPDKDHRLENSCFDVLEIDEDTPPKSCDPRGYEDSSEDSDGSNEYAPDDEVLNESEEESIYCLYAPSSKFLSQSVHDMESLDAVQYDSETPESPVQESLSLMSPTSPQIPHDEKMSVVQQQCSSEAESSQPFQTTVERRQEECVQKSSTSKSRKYMVILSLTCR